MVGVERPELRPVKRLLVEVDDDEDLSTMGVPESSIVGEYRGSRMPPGADSVEASEIVVEDGEPKLRS